ncbi:MAG: hypothetical protein HC842_03220, partial [Cytophagales bacterium]|nr:hypothetical protein [Cytophagales bacterium]
MVQQVTVDAAADGLVIDGLTCLGSDSNAGIALGATGATTDTLKDVKIRFCDVRWLTAGLVRKVHNLEVYGCLI